MSTLFANVPFYVVLGINGLKGLDALGVFTRMTTFVIFVQLFCPLSPLKRGSTLEDNLLYILRCLIWLSTACKSIFRGC